MENNPVESKREFHLLNTEKSKFFDAMLTIAITGQEALSVKQLFTIERLYKNWDDWRIRLAVKIIYWTKL